MTEDLKPCPLKDIKQECERYQHVVLGPHEMYALMNRIHAKVDDAEREWEEEVRMGVNRAEPDLCDEPCCRAIRHANSDATTPGFFKSAAELRGQQALELLHQWLPERASAEAMPRQVDERPDECRERIDGLLIEIDDEYAQKAKALLEGK